LEYLIESPNKYATATAIAKNYVANINTEKLKSTDKILSHYINASNLITLSVK
jgi:hypothetical protein